MSMPREELERRIVDSGNWLRSTRSNRIFNRRSNKNEGTNDFRIVLSPRMVKVEARRTGDMDWITISRAFFGAVKDLDGKRVKIGSTYLNI